MSGPGLNQSFHQRQTQQLVLAPQMRQSLKILQVAALDLRATVQEELQSNPTLEELPMDDVSLEKEAGNGDDNATPADDPREEMDFSKDFQVLEKIGQDWKDHLSDAGGVRQTSSEEDERRQHFFDSLTTETSLQEHLMGQAEQSDSPPPVLTALRFLVGSLDDRGYLTSTLSDLALLANLPLSTMQEAAKLLKTFEPAGIGAESLADCLLIQLAQKGREKSVAARIIRDHFDLLVRRRIPDLARKTGLAPEVIQEAIEEIGTLDPAPGRRFADDANRVVVPDVTVEKDGEEWKIILNQDYIPRLRLSNTYKELIAKGKLSKQEGDYLREKLRSGKFIINAIEQRQRTIERITREIIKHQGEFFAEGVAKLKPLTMTQIADIIGVHETTVSRALANKYIKTPHGVFEMKFFFTSGYQSDAGEAVANTSVKEMIADIIASEDPGKPLSDQEIVGLLEAKGLKIARRTVAKYREELGLLPSNLRRRYD
ncbi:RNA polymerase factor sigma-54 [Opitutus sp. GAS368]|jgi:RNA polymerase sigma-54 factor|uniref:RNA polymerase factor sigma-54 n=1 Tax=Opitutus sp. GAS368 TaxID=1882749 RepID=UPI00087AC7C7|nr:RNA polymerase factor sigma-54 [Opitutus sp. GAS368]SDR65311.1 RNA polymerase, sigma 54 subunit, RpoN/SigL [Opitutus sp. GAS368]